MSPYPPSLPNPPLTSPQDPAITKAKIRFAFCEWRGLTGKFWVWTGGAIRYMVRLRTRLVSYEVMIPPSSVACGATFPLKGEGFLTLCEHGGRGKHGRYGKYHFVLWFAFTICPHPSPSAPPSPSKGKAMVRNTLIWTYFLKSRLVL